MTCRKNHTAVMPLGGGEQSARPRAHLRVGTLRPDDQVHHTQMARCASAAARRAYLALSCSVAFAGCRSGPRGAVDVGDPRLQRRDVFVYPAASSAPARALIFFFGNDVGFWKPHRRLAARLSHSGYDFVGLDIRDYLSRFPATEPQRDRLFGDSITRLIVEAQHRFGDSLPLILAGHSFGAEVALWVADHQEPRGLTGVLAMSPRARGHLFVTPLDWANEEPRGSESWSTIEAVRGIKPGIRIALVRGVKDRFAVHDSAFMAAGGERLQRYVIPFAGHTLKRLLLAGPIIDYAVTTLDTRATGDGGRARFLRLLRIRRPAPD